MSVAIVYSRALSGLHAPLVPVEVHLAGGLPAFNLVGLPETKVKECCPRRLIHSEYVGSSVRLSGITG